MSFTEWLKTDGMKAACLSLLCVIVSIELGSDWVNAVRYSAGLFFLLHIVDFYFDKFFPKQPPKP